VAAFPGMKTTLTSSLLLFTCAAYAQQTISVSGDAEIKVVPNLVILSLGVEVHSKTLAIAREDMEATPAAAVDAGATHIHGVDFETTELRKYRDQARSLAVKAATEKGPGYGGRRTEGGRKTGWHLLL
jgi:uncharacterized protein YggE